MRPVGYLTALRRNWHVLIVSILLGVGIAAGVAFGMQPVYTANATLFVSIDSVDNSLAQRSQFASSRVPSYAQLVRSATVIEATIRELHLDVTIQELGDRVSARNPSNTANIEVSADAPTALEAAAIANSVAAHLSDLVESIDSDDTYQVQLSLLIPANPPREPSEPQRTVILGLGLVAGGAVGVTGALMMGRIDRRVRTPSDVRRATGLPVLGMLPPLRTDASRSVPEARTTLANIRAVNGGGTPRLLLLAHVGQDRAAQRPMLALGRAAAHSGHETLLVETQPPSRGDEFAAPAARGLRELLAGTATIEDVAVRVDAGRCGIVPFGTEPITEVESDAALRGVLSRLLGAAHLILASATNAHGQPITARTLTPFADVTVLVARYGHTNDTDFARMLTTLRIAGVTPLGVILVGVPRHHRVDVMESWVPDDVFDKPREPVSRVRAVRNSEAIGAPSTAPAAAEPDSRPDADDVTSDPVDHSTKTALPDADQRSPSTELLMYSSPSGQKP